MLSSKTLRTFVKMHEYKLDAKISDAKAGALEDQIAGTMHAGTEHGAFGGAEHWSLHEADATSRRRPKSQYFDFIMTTAHR
jgi:hypothetical protein